MIEVKDLCYAYNNGTFFQVLANDHINFTISDGDIVGVVGETGSGKSTLLKQLAGILKPSYGKILIDGYEPDDLKNKFRVGMVFQYPEHQLFANTVYEDIAFGPKNLDQKNCEINRAVGEALNFVGLEDSILKKSPFELSGGEKRRVAIAGVIAMKPKILILDEPTVGLDLKSRKQIIYHLKKYHNEKNVTVFMVSHNMNDISTLCNKVLILKSGRVKRFCDTFELFFNTENLEDYGLKLPNIVEIVKELRLKGHNIDTDVKNVDDLLYEILKLFGGNIKNVV